MFSVPNIFLGELVLANKSKSDIVVLIAALNEEEGIGPTLAEVMGVLGDPYLLVIDGGSRDKTIEVAKGFGADVYVQRGKGKGQAISEGLGYLNSDARYVVFIDADYTYPAKYIPPMIKILDSDSSVGMVVGNRFNSNSKIKKAMKNVYYFGNRLLALTHEIAGGFHMEDPLSGLRVIRWSILKDWRPKSKGFDIEAELNFHVAKKGYRIVEIPIEYRPRLGEKKLSLKHGFTILKRMIIEALE